MDSKLLAYLLTYLHTYSRPNGQVFKPLLKIEVDF